MSGVELPAKAKRRAGRVACTDAEEDDEAVASVIHSEVCHSSRKTVADQSIHSSQN